MRTLWQHCHVATMAQGLYSIIEDAAIVTNAGLIEWIGPRGEVPVVDAEGKLAGMVTQSDVVAALFHVNQAELALSA